MVVIVGPGVTVDLGAFASNEEIRVVVVVVERQRGTYATCEVSINGEAFKDAPIQIRAPRPHAPRRPKFDRSLAREHARRFR